MKKILFIVLSIFLFWLSANAQIDKSLLIRTWKAVKFEESNGKQFPVPPEMKNDYLKFNSDGTFKSLEYGKLLIQGT